MHVNVHINEIYIWGAGHFGVLTALDCEQKGIKIAGFIDGNANQIKTRLGLPVLTFEQAQSPTNPSTSRERERERES